MSAVVSEVSEENSPHSRPLARLASVVLSCVAIAMTFIGLLKFDVVFTRYIRSLNDFQSDHLRDPWLAQLSDLGDQLGKGESLLLVSAMLLAVGYGLKIPACMRAGWSTLLAHALSGVVVNVLKHSIGRARPKFMHAGHAVFSPFSGNDWDSFPSGHAMAAFAVATVLAARLPKARWLFWLLALAISISRLVRGSHYLTDIVGGAILGGLIGALAAHPWKDWRSSLTSALLALTVPLAGCLALISTMTQAPSGAWWEAGFRAAGLVIAAVAVIVFVLIRLQPLLFPFPAGRPLAVVLIGLGIGMFSGSPLVTLILLLTCLAHWVHGLSHNETNSSSHHAFPHEAAFGLVVLLMLYTMIELRGVLPIG